MRFSWREAIDCVDSMTFAGYSVTKTRYYRGAVPKFVSLKRLAVYVEGNKGRFDMKDKQYFLLTKQMKNGEWT